MKTRRIHRSGVAGAVVVGGMILLLGQLTACSRSTAPLSPLASSEVDSAASTQAAVEKIDLRGVQFQHDGSLRADSKPVLDSAIELLKDKPKATIFVDAYCDPTGGQKLNRRLSEKRAEAVATYLGEHGIPAEQVVPRAFGASHFVASNTTSSGRLQNRRIELVIQPSAG